MKLNLYNVICLFIAACICCTSCKPDVNKEAIIISGEVAKPLTLFAEDLIKMKRVTVNVKSKNGEDHAYTGVPVQAIFSLAGVTTGKDMHGKNISKYVLVKCGDGYNVVFSLAEMDSSFNDRQIVLADTMDNKPLPANKGPFQLAVPGEKKPARSCFQVREFVIRFAE